MIRATRGSEVDRKVQWVGRIRVEIRLGIKPAPLNGPVRSPGPYCKVALSYRFGACRGAAVTGMRLISIVRPSDLARSLAVGATLPSRFLHTLAATLIYEQTRVVPFVCIYILNPPASANPNVASLLNLTAAYELAGESLTCSQTLCTLPCYNDGLKT